ncbi:MAG: hypothetical protein NZL91_00885 [Thermoflexales bacterium]|nr:hypothetical protein [Thermoflexales bacterium]MCS7324323.1 hypothetical protein [Thermoflexales bacterium]
MIEHRSDGTCALYLRQPPASLTELCVVLEVGLSALSAPSVQALLIVTESAVLTLDADQPWRQRWMAERSEHVLHESMRWQRTLRDLRAVGKPVVFVLQPTGQAVPRVCGLDAELALACTARVVPRASQWGLSHLPQGLLPFGGACAALVRRALTPHMLSDEADPLAYLQPLFVTLIKGECLEAPEAQRWGWLSASDLLLPPNKVAFALTLAARLGLLIAESGAFTENPASPLYAAGQRARAVLTLWLHVQRWGAHLDDAAWHRAQRLAHVLCGGDLALPQWVSEDYLLALEREAFAAAWRELSS